ncbi:MAG: glycoside-pentoside-hexuronide (GPH):cation symporter [Oscillospiraceae bacterium]|jgi:melibiose permease|nr:glycoside-pentoside-hexuronide (GPH):cation symporter [Oscillospiraceae bacterium]
MKKNWKHYIGYGIGALGMDLSYGLFYSFLSIYLTDILLLSPAFLAVMTFAARIWDGINDPMMGAIVDGTRSRFGKYRRWIVTGALCNGFVLAMLFRKPALSGAGLMAYVAVAYVLWGMTNTMMDIPYWSMVPSLTNDPKERNIAATIPRFFSGMGQFAITILSPILIPLLGHTEKGLFSAAGFFRWAILCAAALVGLIFVTFFSTGKIRAIAGAAPSQNKITAKSVLDTLRRNDQLLVFMLVSLLTNTGWYLVSGLAVYYFQKVLGNGLLMSLFGMLVGGGQGVGLLLLPVLTKWMKRNSVIKLAMGVSAAGYLGMYVFSAVWNVFPLFVAFGFLGMMGVGCVFVSQTVMLSDIVDYGEYKLGRRSDSVVFSMKGFLQKGAYSIQSLIMYLGLAVTGYNGAAQTQPAAARAGISVMMFLLPPVLTLAGLFLFSAKYKLDEKRMREVQIAVGR